MPQIIVIFTSKSKDDVLALGGTAWWKLNVVKARQASHVLLVHNANDVRRPGDSERHGKSFLLGTIRDTKQDEDGRWLVEFDDFAETSDGFHWPGYRNPVTYMDTDEVLGQLEIGDWQRMPEVPFETAQAIRREDDASVARMSERSGTSTAGGLGASSFSEIVEHHRGRLASDLGLIRRGYPSR